MSIAYKLKKPFKTQQTDELICIFAVKNKNKKLENQNYQKRISFNNIQFLELES